MNQKLENNLAPVCIFSYKRLDSLRQCIDKLKECKLSEQTEVFIFNEATKTSSGKIERRRTVNRSFPSFAKTSILIRAWYDWSSWRVETDFALNIPFIEATGCEMIWFLEDGNVILRFSPEEAKETKKTINESIFIFLKMKRTITVPYNTPCFYRFFAIFKRYVLLKF